MNRGLSGSAGLLLCCVIVCRWLSFALVSEVRPNLWNARIGDQCAQ